MKKIFAAIFVGCSLFTMSCQKSLSGIDSSNDGNTTLGSGNLLVRYVALWNDGTTTPTDSSVTTYTYNTAGHLIQQKVAGETPIIYNRDLQERLTSMTATRSNGDTAYSDVYYTGATSTQVAYVLYGTKNSGNVPDSMAFTYASGHVATTAYYYRGGGSESLAYYQNWAFDGSGNVTQLQVYMGDSTFNIGYDFEYDNKINPKYAADDARLPLEWGYTLSPNNISKQTNHYGNPPVMPADYVTYTYSFNPAGKPLTGVHAGTAIAPQSEEMRFYYQ